MIHSPHISDSGNPAEKAAGKPRILGLFGGLKALLGEVTEAKKRLLKQPNRNLIEKKETLEERTGSNRASNRGEASSGLNLKEIIDILICHLE